MSLLKISFIIFISIFGKRDCSINALSTQNYDDYIVNLTFCAYKLVESNFVTKTNIAFHSAPKDNVNHGILNDIIRFIMNQEGPKISHTYTTVCKRHKVNYYIIAATTGDDFSAFIDEIKQCSDWNPGASYLILTTSMESTDSKEFFRLAWKNKMNDLTLLRCNNDSETIEILTWVARCDSNYIEQIHSKKNMKIRNCTGADIVLPKKNLVDVNGCTLKAAVDLAPPFASTALSKSSADVGRFYTVGRFEGASIELVKYVCEKLNMSLRLMSTGIGFTADDALDMIFEDQLDVLLGNMKSKYYGSSDYTFSYPYYYDDVHAVTRSVPDNNLFSEILSIFQFKVFVVYISIFIVSIALYATLVTAVGHFRSGRVRIGEGMSSACAMTLGLPATLPRGARGALALLAVQWIWASFYARTVYQSALINILSDERRARGADSMRALCEAKYTFIVSDIEEAQVLYSNKTYSSGACQFSRNAFVECANVRDCLSYVLRMPAFATLVSAHFIQSQKWKILIEEKAGNTRFRFIRELINTMPLAFQFKRGSPLARKISILGLRFNEAGFMQYHIRKMMDRDKMFRKKFKRTTKSAFHASKFQQLTMNHMTPIFQLFLIGCLLSLMVAMFEIIIYYFQILYTPHILKSET